jgi:hypothetical protein
MKTIKTNKETKKTSEFDELKSHQHMKNITSDECSSYTLADCQRIIQMKRRTSPKRNIIRSIRYTQEDITSETQRYI